MATFRHLVLVALCTSPLSLIGCSTSSISSTSDESGEGGSVPITAAEVAPLLEAYPSLVHASYSAALEDAHALSMSIDAFVAAPSEDTMQDARQAWLVARESYGPTEVYRFYEGPIDVEPGGP